MRQLVGLLATIPLLIAVAQAAPLPRSSPEAQGISSTAVLAFAEAADRKIDQIHSFMLVRHGHVVAEAWWAPYDAETPHVLFSLSKSFTSTAIGLAISEGKLGLDDKVVSFFPELVPADASENFRAMRIRDLLTMAAGQEKDPGAWLETKMGPGLEWTKTFLARPATIAPGTKFIYNTSSTYMLSAILQKVTGQTTSDYLGPRLFEPLGYEAPRWDVNPDGVTLGGYGLSLRTEEIAKFGELYLHRGAWQGQQLIPTSWADAATTRQIATSPSPESDWGHGYGYQFWRGRHDSFRGDGAFGQYAIVLPRQDAVVAITAGTNDLQGLQNLVWEELLPAMGATALPENPGAQAAIKARFSRLALDLPSGERESKIASRVSGKWFNLAPNDRDIEAISFDFAAKPVAMQTRSTKGTARLPIGQGEWLESKGGFVNGMDKFISAPDDPQIAAAGAWSAEDVYTVKISLPETPFLSTMTFRFEGEKLHIASGYTVSFGKKEAAPLEGTVAPAK